MTVIFYQDFMVFLNRIVHIENIRLKPIAKVSFFNHSLYWSNETQSLLKALALKARHISAMGEAHGHGLDIQGCSQVLDENTPIGKIGLRQIGWTVIFYQ